MSAAPESLPPAVAKILARFEAMGREEKMQALVHYARKLEPVPERFADVPRDAHLVPECQTPVALFTAAEGGRLHFWADVNTRQSPTVAAFLAVTFAAVNDQPPAVTLSLPADYVSRMMGGIGLAARETGLNAMVARLKRHAREAADSSA